MKFTINSLLVFSITAFCMLPTYASNTHNYTINSIKGGERGDVLTINGVEKSYYQFNNISRLGDVSGDTKFCLKSTGNKKISINYSYQRDRRKITLKSGKCTSITKPSILVNIMALAGELKAANSLAKGAYTKGSESNKESSINTSIDEQKFYVDSCLGNKNVVQYVQPKLYSKLVIPYYSKMAGERVYLYNQINGEDTLLKDAIISNNLAVFKNINIQEDQTYVVKVAGDSLPHLTIQTFDIESYIQNPDGTLPLFKQDIYYSDAQNRVIYSANSLITSLNERESVFDVYWLSEMQINGDNLNTDEEVAISDFIAEYATKRCKYLK